MKEKKKLWNSFNPLGLFSSNVWETASTPSPSTVMLLFVLIKFTFSHLEAWQAARRFPRCSQHMLCYFEDRIAAADRDPSVFWWRAVGVRTASATLHTPLPRHRQQQQEGASFCMDNPGRKGRKGLEGFRQIQYWGDTAEPGEFCSVPWHWQVPGAHPAKLGFPCSCLGWSLGFLCGSSSWSKLGPVGVHGITPA